MPISPENMRCYPGGSIRSPEWLAIRCAILNRAGHHWEARQRTIPSAEPQMASATRRPARRLC